MLTQAEIEELIPDLQRRLQAYVRRRVRPDKVEDVIQETVLAILKMRDRLDSSRLHWPLACTIARRIAGRPGRWPLLEAIGDVEPAAPVPSPCEEAVRHEDGRRIRAAVDQLDPLKRSIVELRFKEGIPLFRIHRALGLSSSVVRGQYYMAIDRLGRAFAKLAGGRHRAGPAISCSGPASD